ncbi:hypothetical protein TNCV_1513731 [Trichonephila clavipes]|nr:hypothetical protein TNCV_1513731 [Trichonephila clavipes]
MLEPPPPECQVSPLIFYNWVSWAPRVLPLVMGGVRYATEMYTLQDALFICDKQSPDNAQSVAFSQRSCKELLPAPGNRSNKRRERRGSGNDRRKKVGTGERRGGGEKNRGREK